MDIENKYEQELIFQIESKNKKKTVCQKRIIKLAEENLKRLVIDKLDGRNGEC